MNLVSRLVALERRQTQPDLTDTELREYLRPLAQREDLDLDELVEETKRVLTMTDAERDQYVRESEL